MSIEAVIHITCPWMLLNHSYSHKFVLHCCFSNKSLFPTGTFNATLKFLVKDCDPATGLPDSDEGYDDEYMVSCTFDDDLYMVHCTVGGLMMICEHCHAHCLCYLTTGRIGIVVKHMFIQE
jgi:Coatomer gamma subunit appendage domain.